MKDVSILLTFAHRAECQAFLDGDHYKPVPHGHFSLYSNDNSLLLILDEGILNILQNLSYFLGQYPSIKEIWNFGVAGSFDPKLSLHQVFPIRTCYGQNNIEFEFKSYTSNFKNTEVDLVTSSKRVLHESDALNLPVVAQLIDREAWAIGRLAKKYQLSFYPVKIISDFPKENSSICDYVKEQASLCSEKLFLFWKEYSKKAKSREELQARSKENLTLENIEENFPNLYMTQYQKRELLNLLKNQNKNEINQLKETIHYNSLIKKDITGKEKTKVVIKGLKEHLNPKRTEIQKLLHSYGTKLEEVGAKVHFDPALDKVFFNINMNFSSQKDIDLFCETLQGYSFTEIEKIFNGYHLD